MPPAISNVITCWPGNAALSNFHRPPQARRIHFPDIATEHFRHLVQLMLRGALREELARRPFGYGLKKLCQDRLDLCTLPSE